MNNKISGSIIKCLVSIFAVGLFLIGLVSTNEVIETFKARENFQMANYNNIVYYLEAFSEYELDDETSEQVLGLICGIADEINTEKESMISVGVFSKTNNLFLSNDESDSLIPELIHSIDPGRRKIKSSFDYFNNEYGDYRFLVRIEHEGIFNILLENGLINKLVLSTLTFIVLSLILIIFLRKEDNLKYSRTAGIIFIFIWIGSISFYSAVELNNQQKTIVNEEVEHVTSLIEFYYHQDLIEHGDEIEDRRQFAQDNIDGFLTYNGNIETIVLNDNYNEELDNLEGCLDVTINENSQTNKRLEFILSSILFLVLAIIVYDKLSERIQKNNTDKESLCELDNRIITIELINIIGNCLTWSLMLPRLMEVSRLSYGSNAGSYVASIYSAGIVLTTVISILSSSINKLVRNVRTYFIMTFTIGLSGIVLFALFDNFVYNFLAYLLVCVFDGLGSMLSYFYVAGCDDKSRKETFLVKSRSTLNVGQSIGIIVGGVFGSIFRYRTVLLIASFIITISYVMLIMIRKTEFNMVSLSEKKTDRNSIKGFFNKKESFLFLLLIIAPLAFYDVYLDYKFPIDIMNLGLTTAVISFVSMSGRLISAYSAKLTYSYLKKKAGLINMPYIYMIGCVILMLVYQLNSSIIMIILVTAVMGILDSFGTLSYRERFLEISKDESIQEDNANVIVKVGDRFGTSVGPSLISLFNNAVVLPITMAISFVLYKVLTKKK